MHDRHNLHTRKILYLMARVVTDQVPEIKNAQACRDALVAEGFPPDWIKEHLSLVQHMARVIRARDIEHLTKAQERKS